MFDLKSFVTQCRNSLDAPDPAQEVRQVVAAAIADPDSLKAGLPSINNDEVLLHACERLTVVHLRLTPNVHYPPHEHRMAAVIGVYAGTELNIFYDVQGPMLVERGRIECASGRVLVLAPDTIHSVVNLHEAPAGSLHVYLGDLIHQSRAVWSPDTGVAHKYSDETYFALARAFDPARPFTRPETSTAHEG